MEDKDYEQKKRECWEEYTRKCVHEGKSSYGAFNFAFDLAFALGKQEKGADTVIKGWVARDSSGFISLFSYLPDRVTKDNLGYWGRDDGSDEIDLPKSSFPDLTWESDPEPVEIIIKRKKK